MAIPIARKVIIEMVSMEASLLFICEGAGLSHEKKNNAVISRHPKSSFFVISVFVWLLVNYEQKMYRIFAVGESSERN